MGKSVLNVEGMSCEHCVNAITGAVGALEGVSGVSVDLSAKTVTIEHDFAKCPLETIQCEIEDQGFDVVG